MAEEYTRSEYLKALLNQKKAIINQDSPLINPSISNASNASSNTTPLQIEIDKSKKNNNFWTDAASVVDKAISGFLSGIEGIADLGGMAIVGMGELFGADMTDYRKTVEADQSSFYSSAILNGIKGVDVFKDFKKGESTIDYILRGGQYSTFDSTLDTKAGQFLGEAVGTVFNILPSIMIGGGSKIASLASMGASAAGKGSEEAYQEGATTGQALGYGLAKGGVEVVSEIVVSKGLNKLAKATHLDKYLGTFGKINGVAYGKEVIKKAAAKELMTTMIEEGAEEVFSDIFAPACEAIYKGSDAFKQYGDKNYYKQMAKSFAMGAIVGGVTSGVQTSAQYAKYGKSGIAYIQNSQAFQEAYKEFQNDQSDANAKKCQEILGKMYDQLTEMANDPAEAQHLKNLVDLYMNNNSMSLSQRIDALKQNLSEDVYNKLAEDVNSIFERTTGKTVHIVPESSLKQLEDGSYPRAFLTNNEIVINENYKTQMMELIKHEGISHAILDLDVEVRDELVKAIESNPKLNKEFHKMDAELERSYKKSELDSERLATFTEGLLKDYAKFERAFASNAQSKTLLSRLYNKVLDRFAGIKGIDAKFVKSIRTVLNEINAETEVKTKLEPKLAYAKDTLVGKYKLGDNKLEWQVKKTSKGYDIYEKNKVAFSDGNKLENLTAKQVREQLNLVKAKPVEAQTKAAKSEESVLGKWTINEGKNELNVVKYEDKYQVHNRNEIIGEYKTADELRAYMKEANAIKYEPEKPKLLKPEKFSISVNKPVYVLDSNGDILDKVLKKSKEGVYSVITKNESSGEVFTKEFKSYREARASIESYTNKSLNKGNLIKPTENKTKVKEAVKNQKKLDETTTKIENKIETEKKGKKFVKKEVAPKVENKQLGKKIISDVKRTSSTALIEAGADTTKSTKVRLDNVKEAFKSAITESIPKDAKYKIAFNYIKSSYAEINLAELKDYDTAIDNMMEYLGDADVTLELETGKVTEKLSVLLSESQKEEARKIILDVLKGKAEPTKLAKWKESLQLQKIETYETKRNVLLSNRIGRVLNSAKTLNFDFGIGSGAQLSVFENIMDGLPRFWNNAGVIKLCENIEAYYNEENLKELFDQYGVVYDENIRAAATALKEKVVKGEHLNPLVQKGANDLLQLIYNNIKDLDEHVKAKNVLAAEVDANIVQSTYFGQDHNKFIESKTKKLFGSAVSSVTSPIDFFNRNLQGTEFQRFVNEDTGIFENRELSYKDKFIKAYNEIFNKDLSKLMSKEITFKGENISLGVALHRLNLYKTLGEKFFRSKGTKLNKDGTRARITYEPADIVELEKQIPSELLEANKKFLELLNGPLREDVAKLYRNATNTDLMLLDEENVWYHVSRVGSTYGGITMGGTSFKDMNLSMFNKRVNSIADLAFDVSLQEHFENYINNAFKRLVWQPYINKLNTLLNTRVYGETNYKIYQENIPHFSEQLDLLFHEIMGVPFERNVSTVSNVLGKVVGNLNAVRVSTIQTGLRTISSKYYFSKYFGIKNTIKGIAQEIKNGGIFALRKNYNIIKELSPYFAHRFSSNEVLLAETGLESVNKAFRKVLGAPLRFGDAYVHLGLGFAIAQAQAESEGYGKPYSKTNNKRAVYLLEQASKNTQPTSSIGRVAGFRYGKSVFKYLFGLYGSMKQAFIDGMISPVQEIMTYKGKAESIESSIKNHDAKIEEYEIKIVQAEHRLDDASKSLDEKAYREAEKELRKLESKVEGHKRAKANAQEFLQKFKANHTPRKNLDKLVGSFVGLIFSALAYVGINNLIKMWEGKKDLKDVTLKDIGIETIEQAFVNSVPYISTIYSSIRNNSDLSIATIDNLNDTINAVKGFVDAVESGEGGKLTGSSLKMVEEISKYLGIPLQSYVKLINGTWYRIDRESNLSTNNWLGLLSATSLKNNYNDAVKNKNEEKAKANLKVWLYNYSVASSDKVVDEIYRLNSNGVKNVSPSAYMTSYTDANGETVKLTTQQINQFRLAYNKADMQANKLISSGEYKKLDNESKGKLLKKVYSYYAEYAKYVSIGKAPSTRLGNILALTNGNVDLANYIIYLEHLGSIVESKNKTKKQLSIEYINKIQNVSKSEKLLILMLAGYSVAEKEKNSVVNQLVKMGMNKKAAKEFVS